MKSFRYASLGCACMTFMGYGMMNFMPSFAIRVYQIPVAEVGTYMALIIGLTGASAAYTGGYLADRLGHTNRCWYYYVPLIGALVAVPANLFALWIGDEGWMWSGFVVSSFASSLFLPPVIAMAHELVGARARALSSAFVYLVLNIIGLGLGPPTVGLVSDLLSDSLGAQSIGAGMSAVCAVGLISALYFWLAARHLMGDLKQTAAPA